MSFAGIGIASTALKAFQRALDVTGNNIANVNTPGYTREAVTFSPLGATSSTPTANGHSISQGVLISSVAGIRDAFLLARQQGSQSDLGSSQTLSDNLSQIESVLNDTNNTGISNALSTFFNSWSALAASPNDPALQSQVQQAGSALANQIQTATSDLAAISGQQSSDVTSTIQNINADAKTIADLNAKIRTQTASGEQPSALIDQRTQALQDLAKLVDIKTFNQPDGSVVVYSNQLNLVDGSGNNPYPTTFDPTTSTVSDANGTYNVQGGQLAGLFQSMNATAGYQTQLDNLANSIRTQVNAVYQTGTNSVGTTGANFFNTSSGAATFDLDPAIKANATLIASGVSGNSGDGGMASSINNLQTASVASLGNQSVGDYYSGLVGQIGTASLNAKADTTTKTAVNTQIANQVSSVSGVSLDDEMTSMLQFQRSYQAAAQALTMFDQATQSLLTMMQTIG